jgi:serine/threonine protein kinase
MMEYCTLGSVQDVMNHMSAQNLSFSEKDIAYITSSVLSGLSYLHSKGIIHRYIFILLESWCNSDINLEM